MNTFKQNSHIRLWKKYLRRKRRICLNKRKKNIPKRLSLRTKANMPLKYICIPSELSFGKNWENVVKILNDIKYSIKYRLMKRGPTNIDHSLMSSVTPSAVLVLSSTIERSQKSAGVKFKANNKYLPQNSIVRYLLNQIDYWRYFNVPKLETDVDQSRFSFFKILDSCEADNTKIGKMIEFFGTQVGFNGETEGLLFTALCEAAANTVEHGYGATTFNKDTDRWWLTAHIDKGDDEISFVFYDQGIGIFQSLENHKNSKIKQFFNRAKSMVKDKPKAKILKHMVERNFSKYKTQNRGYGIQTFKHFIDEAEDGLLFIASENASYEYPNNILKEYTNYLSGTLIVWKIKVGYDINSNIYLKNGGKNGNLSLRD